MCIKPLHLAGFSLIIQGSSPPGHVVNTLTGCKVFAKCTLRKMVMTRKYFSREEVSLFLFAATCLVENSESDGGSLLLCCRCCREALKTLPWTLPRTLEDFTANIPAAALRQTAALAWVYRGRSNSRVTNVLA